MFQSFSGFGTLWYERTVEAFIRDSHVKRHFSEVYQQHKHRTPFSLKDIQAPFYILIVGYVFSLLAFLVEKFVLPPEKFVKIIRTIRPVNSIVDDFEMNRRKQLEVPQKKSNLLKL